LTVSPTDYNLSVFHRELKKICGIVPQSPTNTLKDYNLSVFHKELKKFTNGFTDGVTNALRTSRSARMSDAWLVDTITDGFFDGSKSLAGFSNFFYANIH
jgi:hypothetical protein